MNCKKCGRPMGKKGYCANCVSKSAKKDNKRLWCILAAAVAVLALALILIFAVDWGNTDSSASSAATQNNAVSTAHAEGSFTAESISGTHHVEIEVQDYGTIKVELDADVAPITVANFLNLAESGFYDGLTFHRIIEGFMMQGGDPQGNGTGGSDIKIKGEFSANGIENNLSHTRGAISMARNGYSMDSASSQFFIVHEDSVFLDTEYACFGYVTEGMDIVDAVCAYGATVVTDNNGTVPAQDQPIIAAVRVID